MQHHDYIDLVENRYFGMVAAGDIAATSRCFTADAVITILHGDNPLRIFKAAPGPSEVHISEFWRHLCGNFAVRFDEFEHFVDAAAHRCSAIFRVTLAPKATSPYFTHGVLTLRNCNFFWIRGLQIEKMLVYYASPQPGGASSMKPTGYPQG